MNQCLTCKWAQWDRTKTGRLHSSGRGQCTYHYVLPELPASMYWMGLRLPKPLGGYIDRRKEHPSCPCFTAAEEGGQ